MAASKDILQPGSTFGRYKIGRQLGSGGMGAVYEAIHTGLGKRVAIKALHPEMAREPEVQVRFLREGESTSRIQHPHIVDIYDVGTQDDITFLVMEYLEGKDLAGLLRERKVLSIEEAVDIILPVIAALLAAHDHSVIHRDLKPANIFLAQGPHGLLTPKVLDFGISKILTAAPNDAALTTTGALLGTPYYMSPEQAAGSKEVDARSDQYSLGVILYQCVTGVRPFQAEAMYRLLHQIVHGDFAPPTAVNPSLPREFEKVVLTAMATDPAGRFSTLKQLGSALLPFASSRLRARWEPIFNEQLTSNDLPSTYHAPAPPAPFAEPVTHNEGPSIIERAKTQEARPKLGLLIGGALLLIAAGLIVVVASSEQEAPIAVPLESPPIVSAPPEVPRDQPPTVIVDAPPVEKTIVPEKKAPAVAKKRRPVVTPAPRPAPKAGANKAPILR